MLWFLLGEPDLEGEPRYVGLKLDLMEENCPFGLIE